MIILSYKVIIIVEVKLYCVLCSLLSNTESISSFLLQQPMEYKIDIVLTYKVELEI